MDAATSDGFHPLVGTTFEVDEAPIELTLTEVDERTPTSFSLLFDGPLAPIMPQSTYTLRAAHSAGAETSDTGDNVLTMFIVPLGPGATGGAVYEAVFAG